MNLNVTKALDNIDLTYIELMNLANDIFKQTTSELDAIMQDAYNDVEKLSNEAIRDLMLRLSLKSYTFSEIKEKAAFKSALAETIRKEKYAQNFNNSEGTVAVRENAAIIGTSAEILSEEIYTLVANMLKTKLYEIHTVISTLQTVLTSRLQEAKLSTLEMN